MKNLLKLFRKVPKLVGFPLKDQFLLFEAFVVTGFVRAAVLTVPFKKLVSRLKAGKQEREQNQYNHTDDNRQVIRKVKWAISIVSKYTPWESKCLVQALTAHIMLKKRKISGTLHLGLKKDESENLVAHAWYISGNIVVTGGRGLWGYTEISKFGS